VSDLQDKILDILADQQFHSGESLGEQLGVSRTAVWKQLQKLEAIGFQLESVKGVGYRAPKGFELLDKNSIAAQITAVGGTLPERIEIFKNIDSTNKYLREKADETTYSPAVVLAETQTSGRGRRGKDWISPFAANLYMSVLWSFEHGAAALEGLSLGIGVAARRALKQCGLEDVQLKWPNDIYVGQKKLGGILLEMVGDPAGQCSVVIGIGINICMPRQAAESIDQDWTDVQTELGGPVSRNTLAGILISEIFTVLHDFQVQGFEPYREEWQSADAFKGMQATVTTPREALSGTVMGVDKSGALEMRMSDGKVQRFIGGELSLRLKK